MNAPNLKIEYENNTKHVILLICNFKKKSKSSGLPFCRPILFTWCELVKPIIMLLVCATPVT